MRPSPIYYLLTKKHKELYPDSKLSQTEEAKNLFLIPVEKPQQILDWKCLEAHVSVYENFSDAKDSVSAFHVTTTCENQDRSKVTTHAFFNFDGDFLKCNAQLKKTKEQIELSAESKMTLKNISETIVFKSLQTMFSTLLNEQSIAQKEKQKIITELEQESLKGMSSREYIRLLEKAIPILAHSANLQLDPREDLALVNLYSGWLQYSKQLAKPKKQPKPAKDKEEKTELPDLSIFKETAEQNSAVKTKLNACRVNDVASIIAFSKELEKLEQEHEQKLFAACKAGDLAGVRQHLAKNRDIRSIGNLLAICVYHGYLEIFDFIYQYNKTVKFVINFLALQTDKLDFADEILYLSGLLSIAYYKKNLIFFEKLLQKYHADPHENYYMSQVSLARLILIFDTTDETDLPYLAALLAAGFDPNAIITSSLYRMNESGSLAPADDLKLQPLKIAGYTDKSLLYTAVKLSRPKTVSLLLEYKADFQAQWQDCPFLKAVDTEQPVPEIIKLFLQRGKDIDQRYSTPPATALYHAAQNGRTNAVKVLLELKANPAADHQQLALLNQKSVIMTPLTVAARKGHMKIVELFLQCNLSAKQIYRPILLKGILGLSPEILNKLETAHGTACYHELGAAREAKNFAKVLEIADFIIKNYSDRISEKDNSAIVFNRVEALYHLNKLDELRKIVSKEQGFLALIAKEDPDRLAAWQTLFENCKEKIASAEAKSVTPS